MAYGISAPDRSSELQLERAVRGSKFEQEIRRSWRLVPNVWRVKFSDGGQGTKPADNLMLTMYCNILSELKRTNKDAFYLSFLRANQAKALRDFDEIINHNYGLVFVSFQNDKEGIDEAYAFRFITGLKYMMRVNRASITLKDFRAGAIPVIELIRLEIDGELGYDLRGLPGQCRFL